MKKFKTGYVINEKEFIINSFRQYSLKSTGFSQLLTLSFEDFLNVV